ncbi:hypothetical protein [Pseudomonas nitroreducens]|uniref:hypothetical protein n=1 Tax=Pseudomonas nitroreducens TaxID=46680 RepID=UPI0028A9F323|nr:hypothetical protein [Pseudomonas nitroreducens]
MEKVNREQLGEQTLAITRPQLLQYLTLKKLLNDCEACGANDWSNPEENGMPSIVATATIRSPGAANWYFPLICENCGNTRLINAGNVWHHYFSSESSDG